MQNDEKKAVTRESRTSDRSYFVLDSNVVTVVDMLTSEQECKNWIIENGELDSPYTIGYSVVYLQPITKKAKITLS